MSDSKAERRKCGLRLHGWPGGLFNHCVLYGITLVKVLSTRIVSISSTLSLILEPNPSMSENMCGLAVRSELDGISHQCVTKSSGRLALLGFLRCNLQSQVCFWHASSVWFPQWSLIETWNWNQLRAHAAAPFSSLIPLMIVHIWSNLRKTTRGVCSLRAAQRRFVRPRHCPPARLLFLHATLISFDQKCINNSSAQLKLFTYWYNYHPAGTSAQRRPCELWWRRLLFNDDFLQRLLSCDAVATGLCLTTAPCVLWATWSAPLSAMRISNLKKGTTGVTPNDEGWSCDFNYVRRMSLVLCSKGAFLRHDLIKQMDDKWQTFNQLLWIPSFCYVL